MAEVIRRAVRWRAMDRGAITAVGVLFFAQSTKRRLFLMRADKKYFGTWGLVGGKVDPGETLLTAIHRECQEEIGAMPDYKKLIPIEQFTSPDDKFYYHTFVCVVEDEFLPTLNYEHVGYAWCDSGICPKPLHPGLWATVNFEAIQEKISLVEAGEY